MPLEAALLVLDHAGRVREVVVGLVEGREGEVARRVGEDRYVVRRRDVGHRERAIDLLQAASQVEVAPGRRPHPSGPPSHAVRTAERRNPGHLLLRNRRRTTRAWPVASGNERSRPSIRNTMLAVGIDVEPMRNDSVRRRQWSNHLATCPLLATPVALHGQRAGSDRPGLTDLTRTTSEHRRRSDRWPTCRH